MVASRNLFDRKNQTEKDCRKWNAETQHVADLVLKLPGGTKKLELGREWDQTMFNSRPGGLGLFNARTIVVVRLQREKRGDAWGRYL
jgi:hypothetical protein